jgi:hypothetical protein
MAQSTNPNRSMQLQHVTPSKTIQIHRHIDIRRTLYVPPNSGNPIWQAWHTRHSDIF